MKFGIGPFSYQKPPWYDGTFEDIYRDGIELVQLAEEVGFDAAWVSEHHFASDGFTPSPFTILAAYASVTDRMELGTAIALTPFYEPLRLAEDVAVLDQINGGRVTVGLGLGYRDAEFEGYRISRRTRVTRLVETAELLKRAWTEEGFTFEGELLEYGPATVRPPPASAPRPRIVIGANIPKAVRRAARHADGYMPSRASGIDEVVDQYRIFKAEKETHDPPVGGYELPLMCFGMVDEDRRTAWEKMLPGFAYFDSMHDDFRATSPDEWFRTEGASDRPGDDIQSVKEDELKAKAFYGTPEELIEIFEDVRGKLEFDERDELHVMFRPRHPGMSFDAVAESVQLFGDEVIPHFD